MNPEILAILVKLPHENSRVGLRPPFWPCIQVRVSPYKAKPLVLSLVANEPLRSREAHRVHLGQSSVSRFCAHKGELIAIFYRGRSMIHIVSLPCRRWRKGWGSRHIIFCSGICRRWRTGWGSGHIIFCPGIFHWWRKG